MALLDFEQHIQEIKNCYRAAGIAISIFDSKSTIYENFFGYRDEEKRLPIDGDTIFGIASLTKSFTCAAIFQLQEQAKLSINDAVSKYMPLFDQSDTEPIKIWHLMSHCAGYYPFKRVSAVEVAKQLKISEDVARSHILAENGLERVIARLNQSQNRLGMPGEQMSYCNDGYGILSELIRIRSGYNTYADYLDEAFFGPMNMTRSFCDFDRAQHDDNAASNYYFQNGMRCKTDQFTENAFVLMGGGAVKSSLHDMKRYVTMYMNGGQDNNKTIISPNSIRQMLFPRVIFRGRQFYGCGLITKFSDNITIHWHYGSLPGVSSYLGWSPELGIGTVVLCNTHGVPVAQIGEMALQLYNQSCYLKPNVMVERPWPPSVLEEVSGTYRSEEPMEVILISRDGKLFTVINGIEYRAYMTGIDQVIIYDRMEKIEIFICRKCNGKLLGVWYKDRVLPKVALE